MNDPVDASGDERRKYPRLNAPVYFRPARRRLPRRQVVDLGLGGMRVYSDEPLGLGARFEVELFNADHSSVTCLTEVVWAREIPSGDPAKFDIGLQFLDVDPDGLDKIRELLRSRAEQP